MQRQVFDKASLSGVRRLIRAELNRVGADPSLSFDCLVAVTEACTSALLHGIAADNDDPAPEVSWEINPQVARFYVTDFSSRSWESRAAHPSGRPEGRPEHNPGPAGLDLIRGLMDEVEVESRAGGTMVSLVKRLR